MDDFGDIFNDKYYRRAQYDLEHSNKYYQQQESKYDRRYEKHSYLSQSTLCVPHRPRIPSKSTVCAHPHQNSSKSTLCSPYHHHHPHHKDEHIIEKNVSNLPYYIVPVIYVPHKPLYDAKKMIEPHIYKAYHCKSKNQLSKNYNKNTKLTRSKSILNLYTKERRKFDVDFEDFPDGKTGKYSFENYDEYFSKYMAVRKSSSEISFCTEKSYAHLPPTAKSSKIPDLTSEKRKSISKNFPELFGTYESPRSQVEVPTWDSPRTTDAFIETESTAKSCTSQQTSLETLRQDPQKDSQGTQTFIKDIKKNVLVLSKDRFGRSRKEPPGETPEIDDLNSKLSDGHLEKMAKKTFGINRNLPRFSVSKLTKSAVPSSGGSSRSGTRKGGFSQNEA